jgi:hypothetical protein
MSALDIVLAAAGTGSTPPTPAKLPDTAWSFAIDASAAFWVYGKNTDVSGTAYNSVNKYTLSGTTLTFVTSYGTAVGGATTNHYSGYVNSSNAFILGSTGNPYILSVAKSNGAVQFEQTLNQFSGEGGTDIRSITTDTSGNILIGGVTRVGTGGGIDCYVAKYNVGSSSWQWGVTLQYLGGRPENTNGVVTDSADNVYASGTYQRLLDGSTDEYRGWLYKWNAGAELQWRRDIYASVANPGEGTFVAIYQTLIDSSNNLYCDTVLSAPGRRVRKIFKFNSSGTPVWTSTGITPSGTDSSFDVQQMILHQATGALYMGGTYYNGDSKFVAAIAKFNDTGGFVWGKSFTSATTSSDRIYSLQVDPAGVYVYALMRSAYSGGTDLFIFRITINGEISNFYGPSGQLFVVTDSPFTLNPGNTELAVDTNTNLIVQGATAAGTSYDATKGAVPTFVTVPIYGKNT